MATVQNVAAFIKQEAGASGMRLHKLLYYAQAWSLVWDNAPLFGERIEAWRDGPVCPHVYGEERHENGVKGDPTQLTQSQIANIRAVLDFYGKKSGDWLSRLTHRERPWRAARDGLPPEAPSSSQIPLESMKAFYAATKWGTGRAFDAAYQRGLDVIVEMPEDEVELLSDTSTSPGEGFLRWMETGDDERTAD